MDTSRKASTSSDIRHPIDGYIRGLKYLPRVLLSVQQDGATESAPVTTRSQTGNAVIITTKRRHSLRKNLSEVAILRPSAGVVFPGALLSADRNLMEGQPTPIALPRAPLTLSVDLPGLENSRRKITDPSNSSVQDAVAAILEDWNQRAGSQGYVNAARSYVEVKSVFSSQQVALDLGFNAKWASGSASSQLSVSSDAETSTVLAYFKQVFYTVTMDTPENPSSVFADGVTLDDIRDLIGADNPPAYVRSVDFGRILMLKMETTSRQTKMDLQGALRQVTSGGVEGSASVKAKYAEIVRNAAFTVVAIGGGAQTAASFTGSDQDLKGLKDYIQKDATFRRDNPGAPIAYTVAFLKDNQIANMGFTTDYTESESVQYPNGFIRLRHSGAYVARFKVSWEEPDESGKYVSRSWSSGQETAGYTHQVDLPGDARKVKIRAEAATGLAWDPWGEVLNVTLDGPDQKGYRITGTTLDRRWDNHC